jgi:uncharacterized protein
VPERSCVGCGRRAPQEELLRFGALEGRLTPGRAVAGRGAYTCRRLVCFERALAQRAFNRALRGSIVVEPGLRRLYTDS